MRTEVELFTFVSKNFSSAFWELFMANKIFPTDQIPNWMWIFVLLQNIKCLPGYPLKQLLLYMELYGTDRLNVLLDAK